MEPEFLVRKKRQPPPEVREEEKKMRERVLAEHGDELLDELEAGVNLAQRGSKRRKRGGSPENEAAGLGLTEGRKVDGSKRAFLDYWTSCSRDLARAINEQLYPEPADKDAATRKPPLAKPTARAPRICCFCNALALYKCELCTRGYCSKRCRTKHSVDICFS